MLSRPNVTAFRFNFGPAAGLGHLMRALTLAKYAAGHVFATEPGDRTVLLSRGVSAASIVDTARSWLDDLPQVTHVVADLNSQGGAAAAREEIASLCRSGRYVAVIDSMPPDHFVPAEDAPAPDLVITPYIGASSLRPPPGAATWLTGAHYAILSEEHWRHRESLGFPDEARVLLACGGSDPSALSLRSLASLIASGVAVDVAMGPLFAKELCAGLEDLAKNNPSITLHRSPKTLAPLIAAARLVVGRPGLTRYEAAAQGRTGVYLCEGSDYRAYYSSFQSAGLAEMYFSDDPGGTQAYLARLRSLSDPAVRTALMAPNQAALEHVDGRGAERVMQLVLAGTAIERTIG